mmetsp:Transcript_105147/g.191259  ORF Transcript_105147/g.191259 Transcript_105147/m.191259 type:complete len:83 (+) Transcript_105147:285-533(+)
MCFRSISWVPEFYKFYQQLKMPIKSYAFNSDVVADRGMINHIPTLKRRLTNIKTSRIHTALKHTWDIIGSVVQRILPMHDGD